MTSRTLSFPPAQRPTRFAPRYQAFYTRPGKLHLVGPTFDRDAEFRSPPAALARAAQTRVQTRRVVAQVDAEIARQAGQSRREQTAPGKLLLMPVPGERPTLRRRTALRLRRFFGIDRDSLLSA